MPSLGYVLVAISCLILLHAGHSTYEHLSILKSLGRSGDRIPTSIIIEACLAFLLFVPGITLATPKLEDVTWRGEMTKRAMEDTDSRMAYLPLGPAARRHVVAVSQSG